MTVHRGESVKPPGDVIGVMVLNSAADAVFRLAIDAEDQGTVSVATSGLDSLTDTRLQAVVRGDLDEVTWEEAETAMRRHTRIAVNFILTVAGGGVVATVGLAASSRVTQATALVAAAIIAPVFEPLARLTLAAVNRHGRVMATGLLSAAVGYLTLIVSALLIVLILRADGHGYTQTLLHSPVVHDMHEITLTSLLLTTAGATTGAIMVAAGRFTQLAGPLIALQLIPATVVTGAALELGRYSTALHSLGQLAINIGIVLAAALIVFGYKHVAAHDRRRPPR